MHGLKGGWVTWRSCPAMQPHPHPQTQTAATHAWTQPHPHPQSQTACHRCLVPHKLLPAAVLTAPPHLTAAP